jgi:hypothetical protein
LKSSCLHVYVSDPNSNEELCVSFGECKGVTLASIQFDRNVNTGQNDWRRYRTQAVACTVLFLQLFKAPTPKHTRSRTHARGLWIFFIAQILSEPIVRDTPSGTPPTIKGALALSRLPVGTPSSLRAPPLWLTSWGKAMPTIVRLWYDIRT